MAHCRGLFFEAGQGTAEFDLREPGVKEQPKNCFHRCTAAFSVSRGNQFNCGFDANGTHRRLLCAEVLCHDARLCTAAGSQGEPGLVWATRSRKNLSALGADTKKA